jgi:hypothetical protein
VQRGFLDGGCVTNAEVKERVASALEVLANAEGKAAAAARAELNKAQASKGPKGSFKHAQAAGVIVRKAVQAYAVAGIGAEGKPDPSTVPGPSWVRDALAKSQATEKRADEERTRLDKAWEYLSPLTWAQWSKNGPVADLGRKVKGAVVGGLKGLGVALVIIAGVYVAGKRGR